MNREGKAQERTDRERSCEAQDAEKSGSVVDVNGKGKEQIWKGAAMSRSAMGGDGMQPQAKEVALSRGARNWN